MESGPKCRKGTERKPVISRPRGRRSIRTDSLLRSITDTSSSISIIATNLDQTIVYWNAGAENLFGYRADEVVDRKKVTILYADESRTRKTMAEANEFILTNRKGTTCDVVERTKNGRPVWLKLTLNPRFDTRGDIAGIIGVGQDITELKQTERKLQHSLQKLRRAVNGTIHAMALTVEKRDPYTAGHQRRATDLARAIADHMGLPKERIDGIRMAGVIHDLGKIYVPAEILNKPGRLNTSEFTLIKAHPEAGYDVVKYIDFPWPIGQILLQHHERLDGSGYPNGLAGDRICLEARILAVADVVESMSSHRPYRPALGLERALDEIREKRGILYDPDVVDACLQIFKEERYHLRSREEIAA